MSADERYNRITAWLSETHAEAEEQHSIPLKRNLPSPAPTDENMQRDGSPSKRQRVAGDNTFESAVTDGNVDIDQTPRSGASTDRQIFTLPRFPPNPASITSTGSSHKSRSRSPTKKTQSLAELKKPVYYVSLIEDATDQLPSDVRGLYTRIRGITEDHREIFPTSARAEISNALGTKKHDLYFYRDGEGEERDKPAVQFHSLAELSRIQGILSEARLCFQRHRSEHAWNADVHVPIIQVALSQHPCVIKELATTARILPSFLPPMSAPGNLADSKMIDLVLALELDGQNSSQSDKLFASSIRQKVWAQPPDKKSINQTSYSPLQLSPIAVSMEAKATGSAEEGRTQLGVWTAAWHRRMNDFATSDTQPNIITLPLILMVEHGWELYFACDRGHSLEIVGPMDIAKTSSLTGLYTIVAVLRQLAIWVNTTFRDWIISVLDLPKS